MRRHSQSEFTTFMLWHERQKKNLLKANHQPSNISAKKNSRPAEQPPDLMEVRSLGFFVNLLKSN